MGNIKVKNLPQLHISTLLRRRKIRPKDWLQQQGITNYEALLRRCANVGCAPWTQEEFLKFKLPVVNSPSDGIVVLEPPLVIDEKTGSVIDPTIDVRDYKLGFVFVDNPEQEKKRKKKQKESKEEV